MRKIILKDAKGNVIEEGNLLIYSEDISPRPVFDYADSIEVLENIDHENQTITRRCLLMNNSFRPGRPDYVVMNFNPEIRSLKQYPAKEISENIIEVTLSDTYLPSSQGEATEEFLVRELKILRNS